MRRITTLAFSAALLASTAWVVSAHAQTAPDQNAPAASSDQSAPASDSGAAPSKPAKHHHHAMTHAGSGKTDSSQDQAVDDLNAKSLDDAKSGKSFAPPTTPPPSADSKSTGKPSGKWPHHHHHMAKSAGSGSGGSDNSSSNSPSTPPQNQTAPSDMNTPPK